MAKNDTNIHGFNVQGSDSTPDQFGHFLRDAFTGAVSGLAVSQTGTPSMAVSVAAGTALLTKNTVSSVVAEVKAAISVAISTASTSNPRIDAIIIYEDTDVTITPYIVDGVGGRFKVASVVGTPAASPTLISDAAIQSEIGAGKPWARLDDVIVAANTTTIINSNIIDRRELLTSSNPFWIAALEAWTFSSYTSATGIGAVAVPTGAISKYAVDQLVRLYQVTGGLKWGRIARVQTTTLTVQMLEGAVLNNEAIYAPVYSGAYMPTGAPASARATTLGYAEITSNFSTTSGTPVLVTGLSKTIYIPDGYTSSGEGRIEVEVYSPLVQNSIQPGIMLVSLWDGAVGSGTKLEEADINTSPGGSQGEPLSLSFAHKPSVGSKTYSVGIVNVGGTTTLNARVGGPAFLRIKRA